MTTDIRRVNEMEAWSALLSDAEFEAGSPEYRYETRLALADSMLERKVIDCGNGGSWSTRRFRLTRMTLVDRKI